MRYYDQIWNIDFVDYYGGSALLVQAPFPAP
jgi:hypothetical protein